MEFGHEVHQRTSLMLINASEELIETLEDNQVYFNYSIPILSGNCIICIHEYCHVPVIMVIPQPVAKLANGYNLLHLGY